MGPSSEIGLAARIDSMPLWWLTDEKDGPDLAWIYQLNVASIDAFWQPIAHWAITPDFPHFPYGLPVH